MNTPENARATASGSLIFPPETPSPKLEFTQFVRIEMGLLPNV